MYLIILIGFSLASWIVSSILNRKFEQFSEVGIRMTGKEVAEKMLRDNGLSDIKVERVSGRLTDYYDPSDRTVHLSDSVYDSATIAAAAVAAHECGHAIQHDVEYAPLSLRTALVPIVEFSNRWVMWVLLIGCLMINTFPTLMLAGIGLFACTTLFSFITLPVEINASQRAVEYLDNSGIANDQNKEMATEALKWAAYTYVIAALASLATLMYYIFIFLRRR